MQIKDKLKPILPHLIAVLIFTVVSFVYFYPVLEGKVLKANDSTVSKINSKEIQDFREKTDGNLYGPIQFSVVCLLILSPLCIPVILLSMSIHF